MEALDEGCFTALAASSEVTESNENLLEGVCEGGRPSSIIAIGTPSPSPDLVESLPCGMVRVADDERDGDGSSEYWCGACRSWDGCSGVDGKRPNGSGDIGMTGESS